MAPIISNTFPRWRPSEAACWIRGSPTRIGRRSLSICPLDNLPDARARLVGRDVEAGGAGLALDTADVVVCAGNGLGDPSNLHYVDELALVLDGAVGATRRSSTPAGFHGSSKLGSQARFWRQSSTSAWGCEGCSITPSAFSEQASSWPSTPIPRRQLWSTRTTPSLAITRSRSGAVSALKEARLSRPGSESSTSGLMGCCPVHRGRHPVWPFSRYSCARETRDPDVVASLLWAPSRYPQLRYQWCGISRWHPVKETLTTSLPIDCPISALLIVAKKPRESSRGFCVQIDSSVLRLRRPWPLAQRRRRTSRPFQVAREGRAT